ncbi:hypothetical protein CLOSTMETH_00425 [[Clostridium] methylpentosum DSM 5476]|uniref:Uncharacterized protein n=1 Tax=[Clostridium] methylpentosum DSM 5476 TaxID=537013 RepID=C0E9C7_9FIRM|nr:hypothetical protein CLOSTMETH_00425 [[Clostridium] methylpentosum DSM 5476]
MTEPPFPVIILNKYLFGIFFLARGFPPFNHITQRVPVVLFGSN